jgi:hypothetical protein
MKIITLSFLIFPLILLSQVSISAKDAYEIKSYTYIVPGVTLSYANIITVPVGESWYISSNGNDDYIAYRITSNSPITDQLVSSYAREYFPEGMWTEGTTIDVRMANSYQGKIDYVIYKFRNSDITLATNFNTPPNNSRIFVYPNPTTNELALNSDKVYQIEVFDLTGNKVMEFKGNTISVEHLSSATYIVNAIDLETKESLSYKVIKK